MKVEVQRLLDKGCTLNNKALSAMPKSRGFLNVLPDRDERARRATTVADLVSDVNSAEPSLLPILMSAFVFQMDRGQIMISGIETIGGVQFAQIWHGRFIP